MSDRDSNLLHSRRRADALCVEPRPVLRLPNPILYLYPNLIWVFNNIQRGKEIIYFGWIINIVTVCLFSEYLARLLLFQVMQTYNSSFWSVHLLCLVSLREGGDIGLFITLAKLLKNEFCSVCLSNCNIADFYYWRCKLPYTSIPLMNVKAFLFGVKGVGGKIKNEKNRFAAASKPFFESVGTGEWSNT